MSVTVTPILPEEVLYQTFKNCFLCPGLLVPALFCNLVGIPGITMNAFVVYTTIRSSVLNGTSNWLIGVLSAGEVLHQIAHIIFLGVVLTGVNFVSFITEVRMELLSIFGLIVAVSSMSVIAFDRLVCVMAPMSYHKIDTTRSLKWVYLSATTGFCFLAGAIGSAANYIIGATLYADIPVTGVISDILLGPINWLFLFVVLTTSVFNVTVYVAIWRILKKRNAAEQRNNRIVRSLVAILAVNVIGYTFNTPFNFSAKVFNTDNPVLWWWIAVGSGVLINLTATLNGPVLFLTSEEYRKEFVKFGPRFLKGAAKWVERKTTPSSGGAQLAWGTTAGQSGSAGKNARGVSAAPQLRNCSKSVSSNKNPVPGVSSSIVPPSTTNSATTAQRTSFEETNEAVQNNPPIIKEETMESTEK